MKIKEIQAMTGVPAKSLRFYEEEGLIKPQRDSGNGYREYTPADAARVERIRLMRKLGMPIAEIKAMTENRLTVADAARRQAIALERGRENLAACQSLCQTLEREQTAFDALDAKAYLAQMEQMEQGGVSFMDVQKDVRQRKLRGAFIAGGIMILLMAAWMGVFISLCLIEMPPVALVILLLAAPAAVIVGIVIALKQRVKEIKGGEEDAAGQY